MHPERAREAFGDLRHHAGQASVDAIDEPREIERLQLKPDRFMLVRGEDLSWLANCYPADRHNRARFEPGAEVNDAIDADLRSPSEMCAMENGRPGRGEHFIADFCPDHVAN